MNKQLILIFFVTLLIAISILFGCNKNMPNDSFADYEGFIGYGYYLQGTEVNLFVVCEDSGGFTKGQVVIVDNELIKRDVRDTLERLSYGDVVHFASDHYGTSDPITLCPELLEKVNSPFDYPLSDAEARANAYGFQLRKP